MHEMDAQFTGYRAPHLWQWRTPLRTGSDFASQESRREFLREAAIPLTLPAWQWAI